MTDLPDDWFEDHAGQMRVLNVSKVEAELERLRRRSLSDADVGTLQAAVENLRSAERREAAWRIAAKLEQIAKRASAGATA